MATDTLALTDDDLSKLAHHCRIAAERYDVDAKLLLEPNADGSPLAPGFQRLADQFTRQAAEARALAEKLEG